LRAENPLRAARAALAAFGDKALSPLVEALRGGAGMHAAAATLDELKWEPKTADDGVRLLTGCGRWRELRDRDPGLAPVLAGLLGVLDENGKLRALAVLARWGNREAAPGIAPMLSDRGDRVARTAAETLRSLGWEPADERQAVAFHAALRDHESMAKRGPAALPAIVDLLKGGNSGGRAVAARALGAAGDPSAREALFESVRADPSESVRSSAAESLKALGWVPAGDLEKVAYAAGKGDWDAVAKIGGFSPEGEAAVARLMLESPLPAVRAGCAGSLGGTGNPSAIPALVKASRDPDGDVAAVALSSLGSFRDEAAIEALAERLSDGDPRLAGAAGASLRKIGAPAAKALCSALGREASRKRAAETLVGLKADAIVPLVDALSSPDAGARAAAAGALAEITGEEFLGEDQSKWREWLARRKGG
jgi:HEAT repeat protein